MCIFLSTYRYIYLYPFIDRSFTVLLVHFNLPFCYIPLWRKTDGYKKKKKAVTCKSCDHCPTPKHPPDSIEKKKRKDKFLFLKEFLRLKKEKKRNFSETAELKLFSVDTSNIVTGYLGIFIFSLELND